MLQVLRPEADERIRRAASMVDEDGRFARELLEVMRQDRQDLVQELRLLRSDHIKAAQVLASVTARIEGWDTRHITLENRIAAVEDHKADRSIADRTRATNVALTLFTIIASAIVAYLTVEAQINIENLDHPPQPKLQGP